jgi:hypothetical protein
MGFSAAHAPNQIHARRDVSPLIAPTHLQRARKAIVQHEIVVCLQQGVAELGVGDSFVTLGAPLHRFFCEHRIHGEVFSHVTHELDRAELREPLTVVHKASGIGAIVEIQKASELRANAGNVFLDTIWSEQLTLARLATGIADKTGAATDKRDRRVPLPLHVRKRHHDEQRSDVQARRGGIETDIAHDPFAREHLADAFGGVIDEAAPL